MLLLCIVCVISVFVLLCFRAHLFIDALLSPAGKGLTSWLSFVMSSCEVVTFPLVSCLIVSIPDLCPLSYLYNMGVIYVHAVMYCLCQNPNIKFEPVSSKMYKLICVPIHTV